MTNKELAAIKAREKAATPGPWKHGPESHGVYRPSNRRDIKPVVDEARTPEDATFIAHARQDILALVEEIENLRGLLEQITRETDTSRERFENMDSDIRSEFRAIREIAKRGL